MLRGAIPIGKIWGIDLKLHWSWFFIFSLVTWLLIVSYFPVANPEWNPESRIAAGVISSVFFFGSLLFHELMHSRVALNQGMRVRSIILFALGGVSQIAGEPKRAGDELWMALAGPASSLALGGVFRGRYYGFRDLNQFGPQFVAGVAYWLGIINVALGIFNLVPGFPLDGGRVLRSILWGITKNVRKSTRIASIVGQGFGYLFILAGVWFFFSRNFFGGIWLVLIGWFLIRAASSSYQQLVLQNKLKDHTVSEIMNRECVMVSPDLSLEKLINENILTTGRRCFPVVSNGRVEGLVTIDNIRRVPLEQRSSVTVGQAMITLDRVKWVKPGDDLAVVMQVMMEYNINQVPVILGHTVFGIVNRDSLINFINYQMR